jgi:hypothetical protein
MARRLVRLWKRKKNSKTERKSWRLRSPSTIQMALKISNTSSKMKQERKRRNYALTTRTSHCNSSDFMKGYIDDCANKKLI